MYTYHSIKEAVDGIGLEKCKNILLSHIVKGKFEVKDIPRGTGSDNESGLFLQEDRIILSGCIFSGNL